MGITLGLFLEFPNIVVLEPSQEQKQLKWYPDRFRNGREKGEQTNRHFVFMIVEIRIRIEFMNCYQSDT